MPSPVNYTTFIAYCNYIRKAFVVKGIVVYSERANQKLKMIGCPFEWRQAGNDNEASR
jgi:hypothetical protein